jgi:hypothetical protein
MTRPGALAATLAILALILGGILGWNLRGDGSAPVVEEDHPESETIEVSRLLSIQFGQDQVWPLASALTAVPELDKCRWAAYPGGAVPAHIPGGYAAFSPPSYSCVFAVMGRHGGSKSAQDFFRLTGWFLTSLAGEGQVKVGGVLNPWLANENNQYVLLGGNPPVVQVNTYVTGGQPTIGDFLARTDEFKDLKTEFPNVSLWGLGPTLESIQYLSDKQRFVFLFRFIDG